MRRGTDSGSVYLPDPQAEHLGRQFPALAVEAHVRDHGTGVGLLAGGHMDGEACLARRGDPRR
jgi:hypothetical protein